MEENHPSKMQRLFSSLHNLSADHLREIIMNYAMENDSLSSKLLLLSNNDSASDNSDNNNVASPSLASTTSILPPPSLSGEYLPSFNASNDSFTARSPDLSSSGEVYHPLHHPHSMSLYAFNSGSDISSNASPMLSNNRRLSYSSASSSSSAFFNNNNRRCSNTMDIVPHLPSWNWSYYYYKESNTGESSKRVVVDEAAAEESKSQAYYWNEEFQEISERIRDVDLYGEEQLYVSMANLYHDFEYAVETYGKIIIAERFLPVAQKSIPPAYYVGGQAGGEKYIVQGILFKFAVDKNNLYNGDHYAAKAAGHDLKSLIQVYKSKIPGIYVPMMCLVDYLGYRLIAMSMLPVDTSTLCYGSCDGGMEVHDDIPEFNNKMLSLGKVLNLKVHAAGSGGKEIVGPCDIEGHRGRDNRFYLLDFARLFPPEAPLFASKRKNEHLYRLLRPELVRKFDVPLSSDAFTLFGKRGAGIHNKEVRMATEHLINTLIPRFAGILDFQEGPEDWPKHPNHYKIKITEAKLAEILHREGINIRHLGRIRSKVASQRWRDSLLAEIVARVCKNTIREKLRSQMEKLKHPGLVPYRQSILEYLNLVFGNTPQSTEYWTTTLVEKIELHYEDALTYEKQNNITNIKTTVDLMLLFASIRRLTGMVFSPHYNATVAQQYFDLPTPFQDTDLLQFPPKIKEMRIAAYARATALYLRAKYNADQTDSTRLAALASDLFNKALRSSPDDDTILCNYALCLRFQKKFEEASTYFKAAIQANPKNTRIMTHYAWFLYQDLQRYDKAEKYYLKVLELDPLHSRSLSDYANFLWRIRKDNAKAEGYWKKAVEVGDKQGLAGYASFLVNSGRSEEAKYYEEHLKSASGILIMNGMYS